MQHEQLTLGELLYENRLLKMSSDELAHIIKKLQDAKDFVQKREAAQRKKQEQEEAHRHAPRGTGKKRSPHQGNNLHGFTFGLGKYL